MKQEKPVKVFAQQSSLLPLAKKVPTTGSVLLMIGGNPLILKGLALQVVVQNSADYSVSRCFGNNLLLQSFGATPTIITIAGVESLMPLTCTPKETPNNAPMDVASFYTQYGVTGTSMPKQRVIMQVTRNGNNRSYSCIPVDLQQQVIAQPQNPMGPLVSTYKLTMIGVPQS